MPAPQDSISLVTGGASGMGRIIARRLAQQGDRVAIVDVNEVGLAETAALHDNITAFVCDISSAADVQARVAEISAAMGHIDKLVHCAALMPSHKLMDHDDSAMERLFRINYFGTIYMIKAVLPAMQKYDAGRIIVFGSIAGHALVTNMGGYCATKSAVNTYVEILQNELRNSKVNIHLVCPPAVNTPLVDQSLDTDSAASLREAKEKGRLADPEKIVDAIEKGVRKNKAIIYPGEARLLQIWHTLLPGLWWRTVLSFEK